MEKVGVNFYEISFKLKDIATYKEDKGKIHSILDYANFKLNQIACAPDELTIALVDYKKEMAFEINSSYPFQKELEPKLVEFIPLLQQKIEEENIALDLTQEPQLNVFALYKEAVVLPSLKNVKGPKLGK